MTGSRRLGGALLAAALLGACAIAPNTSPKGKDPSIAGHPGTKVSASPVLGSCVGVTPQHIARCEVRIAVVDAVGKPVADQAVSVKKVPYPGYRVLCVPAAPAATRAEGVSDAEGICILGGLEPAIYLVSGAVAQPTDPTVSLDEARRAEVTLVVDVRPASPVPSSSAQAVP